jgi:hypothetical protein
MSEPCTARGFWSRSLGVLSMPEPQGVQALAASAAAAAAAASAAAAVQSLRQCVQITSADDACGMRQQPRNLNGILAMYSSSGRKMDAIKTRANALTECALCGTTYLVAASNYKIDPPAEYMTKPSLKLPAAQSCMSDCRAPLVGMK